MAAVDTLLTFSPIATGPASGGFAVTTNDTNELTFVTRGILVGVAGAVKVTMANGDVVTIPTLTAGVIHPIRAKIIWANGTAATSIIGFY